MTWNERDKAPHPCQTLTLVHPVGIRLEFTQEPSRKANGFSFSEKQYAASQPATTLRITRRPSQRSYPSPETLRRRRAARRTRGGRS